MATTPWFSTSHPCWLAPENIRPLARCEVRVVGEGRLVDTVRSELAAMTAAGTAEGAADGAHGRRRVAIGCPAALTASVGSAIGEAATRAVADLGPEGYAILTHEETLVLTSSEDRGLLYGFYALLRGGEGVLGPADEPVRSRPATDVRMVNQWDNLSADAPMGSVERGYAGESILFADGRVVADRTRIRDYARLLASVGVNALSINNVNVHGPETRLLTEHLDDVAEVARILGDHGITTYLSINYAAPIELGELTTADPLDPEVASWWARTSETVFAAIPDLGGYLVKADSENRPGPFTYGRDHADGANMLAAAVAPHGGTIFWRCFVYDCRQDWRDRSTDRARAAYDHFMPLDGAFADNVVLQVKSGPMDFQVREPVSPLIGGLERTNLVMELQITQEYTGQQRHVCYLVPQWKEVLDHDTRGVDPQQPSGARVADIVAGRTFSPAASGLAAVSNIGDDVFWTGHPLAQANLYGYGRLAWDPTLTAEQILAEWSGQTFPGLPDVHRGLTEVMLGSWRTYERYTAPLGVGWMVNPHHHYGPNVEGYEYSAWGTYHFADRDGVGVDRTAGTGTGYTRQYREPWSEVYEDLTRCPDELLLFFHHVPYGHVLHSGVSVVQHIYDTHFAGVDEVESMARRWSAVADQVEPELAARVSGRLEEQLISAREWRDTINTYFWRASGVADARGRTIY